MQSLSDLYIAAGMMVIVSLISGLIAARLARHMGKQVRLVGMLVLVGLLVWAGFHLRGSLVWAKIIPWSGVPVAGNWAMPLAAMVVGIGWRSLPEGLMRRLALMLPLLGIATYSTLQPFFVQIPVTRNIVIEGLHRQSTDETCSPAAAATLLQWHGIRTTEKEMAELARTNLQGTTSLGLYRSLVLKTRGTPFGVGVMTSGNRQMLGTRGMAILTVGYTDTQDPMAQEMMRNGFQPGVFHSVVFFRFLPNGMALIGDPSTGMEQWPAQTLRFLWQGEAIYLTENESWGS